MLQNEQSVPETGSGIDFRVWMAAHYGKPAPKPEKKPKMARVYLRREAKPVPYKHNDCTLL